MSSSSGLYKDSLPSEKAPAPENPLVILQNGLHLMHFPVFSIGQNLSSTLFPSSISRIFFALFP